MNRMREAASRQLDDGDKGPDWQRIAREYASRVRRDPELRDRPWGVTRLDDESLQDVAVCYFNNQSHEDHEVDLDERQRIHGRLAREGLETVGTAAKEGVTRVVIMADKSWAKGHADGVEVAERIIADEIGRTGALGHQPS